jgi:hypothetical protein
MYRLRVACGIFTDVSIIAHAINDSTLYVPLLYPVQTPAFIAFVLEFSSIVVLCPVGKRGVGHRRAINCLTSSIMMEGWMDGKGSERFVRNRSSMN